MFFQVVLRSASGPIATEHPQSVAGSQMMRTDVHSKLCAIHPRRKIASLSVQTAMPAKKLVCSHLITLKLAVHVKEFALLLTSLVPPKIVKHIIHFCSFV